MIPENTKRLRNMKHIAERKRHKEHLRKNPRSSAYCRTKTWTGKKRIQAEKDIIVERRTKEQPRLFKRVWARLKGE